MNRSGCNLEHRQKSTSSSKSNKKNLFVPHFYKDIEGKTKYQINLVSIPTRSIFLDRPTDLDMVYFHLKFKVCAANRYRNITDLMFDFKKKKIICLLLGALDFRAGSRLSNTHTPYSYERIVLKLCTTARNGLL